MFPANVFERSYLVQISFLQLVSPRDKLLFIHEVKAHLMDRVAEMSQLQILYRRPSFAKARSSKSLKLSKFSVVSDVQKRVILSHRTVMVFSIFKFVGQGR